MEKLPKVSRLKRKVFDGLKAFFDKGFLAGVSILVVFACAAAVLYSKEVPVKEWWQLDFKISKPQMRYFKDYDGRYRNFLSMTYRVTNKTNKKIHFYPDFVIKTDVNTRHLDTIFPKLQTQLESERRKNYLNAAQVTGPIGPGETKQGVAIFKNVDDWADKLIFYCFGFTNAYKFDERDESKILYEVWRIDYHRPGDEIDRQYDKLIFIEEKWDYQGLR